MFRYISVAVLFFLCSCEEKSKVVPEEQNLPDQFLIVLGVAQDAGYPQAGCEAPHCQKYWQGDEGPRYATSLGLVDKGSGKTWLFEATPDFKEQLHLLYKASNSTSVLPDGIFITHAHIGHYTGLMFLGREAAGSQGVSVHVMPKMKAFLENNGPWSQLIKLQNIVPRQMEADTPVVLTDDIQVTPLLVPHRDEFSETVGYIIESSSKRILFIPDIDKWVKWDTDIRELIKTVDVALLDGTFYNNAELPNRDMSEIPHPFIEESVALFQGLPEEEKAKITFIHFNHSNPLIFDGIEKSDTEQLGFKIARRMDIIGL